jgi:hypothetical protein
LKTSIWELLKIKDNYYFWELSAKLVEKSRQKEKKKWSITAFGKNSTIPEEHIYTYR